MSQTNSRLLFLCTGNYYRSRFAEILFNHLAAARGSPWVADSRGLALDPGNAGNMSRHTLEWCRKLGLDPEPYQRRPREAEAADFAAARHIVAVKRTEHLPIIARRFAEFVDLVEFWEVHDLDCAGPESALPQLEREVQMLLERLSGRT
jgi:protein-tyrosine phosphatase